MSEQNGCSFPSGCLAVSLWDGVSFPPLSIPSSCRQSLAAMPLHCEDMGPGWLLVPIVNTGGEEGRDGSSWLH